jgi:hypothetical protein
VTPSPESITVPVNDLLVTCQVGYHTRRYSDMRADKVTVCEVNFKKKLQLLSAGKDNSLCYPLTWLEVQDAANASTACTAMYSPGTLKVSNMISAVYSLFSGGLRGGSVCFQGQRQDRENSNYLGMRGLKEFT